MTRIIKAAALAGVLVAALTTASPGLNAAPANNSVREGEAVVTKLSANSSAITYWVSQPDGWHVVTTVGVVIGQDGEAQQHAVVRFSSVLLPGQSQLVSVPLTIGEPQQHLRISRLGDRIEVARVRDAADGS
jgi:hypothetical protein